MRYVSTVLVWAFVVAALPAHIEAADWPVFRGPNGDGISSEKIANKDWKAKPPKKLWEIKLSDSGHAGPVVAGGKLYIIDHVGGDDVVRAIDINSGNEVWSFKYAEPGANKYGFTNSSPLVAGGRVYTVSRSGLTHCLDAATGAKVWSRNIVKDFKGRIPGWKLSASPILDAGRLIVCPGGPGALVAGLDPKTGSPVFKGGGTDKVSYSTPVVATVGGRKQLLVFSSRGLSGVDPSKGSVLWTQQWKTSYDVNASTPLVCGRGAVFISSGYGKGCAMVQVGAGGARKLWENKNVKAHFSSPVYKDGYIYANSDPTHLVCIDARTGDVKWKHPGFEKGSLIAADGCIIAQDGKKGVIRLVKMTPAGYTELGSVTPFSGCRGQAWCGPIFADGRLFARDRDRLVCLDLR